MKMRGSSKQLIPKTLTFGVAIALSSLTLVLNGCTPGADVSDADSSAEAESEIGLESTAQTSDFITTDPNAVPEATSQAAEAEDEFAGVRDLYEEALKYGSSATSLSQSAFTSQDWELVASRWQKAIALLERVPAANANYEAAQQKLQEYRTNLNAAQQKVTQPSPNRSIELSPEELAAARRAAQQSASTAGAGEAGAPAATSSFLELCNTQSSLADEAQRTVQALLELADTDDCEAAATALSAQAVLDLGGKNIVDVQPLASMTQVTELRLGSNAIADLSPLTALTNLETLLLNNNQITDVTPLGSLTGLKTLVLNNNQITNIAPLATLTTLERLELRNNAIEAVAELAPLTQLKTLALTDNPLSSQRCPVEDKAVCQF